MSIASHVMFYSLKPVYEYGEFLEGYIEGTKVFSLLFFYSAILDESITCKRTHAQ